ncbi:helix-turn-helix transcriptional regulator [Saccharothrix texasensis]|uniref:DNA-binding XRE family transcriptional regulator n=1 Tax=Saccharothrix texasensis TaxID=103734 RepID=A0A3N1H4J5_9PSEU|nr:helix-turn-helix transcriptional regulator [Saccharothrix texasensis]ROP37444.1 DNA-binding XRE family transcriptional regulator [Saccharothrix texasensis]
MTRGEPPRARSGSTDEPSRSQHRGRAHGTERAELAVRFGGVLRAERAAWGWSQVRLAEAAGVTRESVYRLEGGRQRPSTTMTFALAKALRPGADLRAVVELEARLRIAAGDSLREFSQRTRRRRERLLAEALAGDEVPVNAADPFAGLLMSYLAEAS